MSDRPEIDREPAWQTWVIGGVVLLGLYLASLESYLLFHALAELFSVAVAGSIFAVTWTSRRHLRNGYLLVVGVGYLALGALDLLHTLAYQGMPIFPGHPFAANQLWIAARGLESVTAVAALAALRRDRRPDPAWLLAGFVAVTALLVASIFWWRVFPACFVAGAGQTAFKIAAEYVIIGLLGLAVALLHGSRARFDADVFRLVRASLLAAIACEFAFTLYVSNYGPANLAGHALKVVSYFLAFRAIVETGVRRPVDLVFRELASTNERLRTALDEIKTLRGVIPICSHCKKIRDDAGSWAQLEAYLIRHSDAQFSHGICPECLVRHYGD